MKKRLSSMVMAVIMVVTITLLTTIPAVAITVTELNKYDFFVTHKAYSGECVLTSVAMMVRRGRIINGDNNWKQTTLSSVRVANGGSSTVGSNPPGMKHDVTINGLRVRKNTNAGLAFPTTLSTRKTTLKNLLDKHPEGIVVHADGSRGSTIKGEKYVHAVLLTHYVGDTFYCVETFASAGGKIIKLVNSSFDGTQDKIINGFTSFWYVYSGIKAPTTFTIKYNANGGTGTMANTTVTRGVSTATRKNAFTRTGYTFNGWHVRRDHNNTWRYKNSAGDTGWYVEGKQPSGWYKSTYSNGGNVSTTTSVGNTVTFFAQWKVNTYTVKYNANGGTGAMADTVVTYGVSTATRPNSFIKDGYTFTGWQAHRNSDNKWRYQNPNNTSETGWYLENEQPSNWVKYHYRNGSTTSNITSTNGAIVTFYATWIEDNIIEPNPLCDKCKKEICICSECESCGKNPCECVEICEDCNKNPCECSEDGAYCSICGKDPCECVEVCEYCNKVPCECVDICVVCNSNPCECVDGCCGECNICLSGLPPVKGRILGDDEPTIFDCLEILKFLVQMESAIYNCEYSLNASLIVDPQATEPTIFDALEILKYLVGTTNLVNSQDNQMLEYAEMARQGLELPEDVKVFLEPTPNGGDFAIAFTINGEVLTIYECSNNGGVIAIHHTKLYYNNILYNER